jgi:hypothetical protein
MEEAARLAQIGRGQEDAVLGRRRWRSLQVWHRRPTLFDGVDGVVALAWSKGLRDWHDSSSGRTVWTTGHAA